MENQRVLQNFPNSKDHRIVEYKVGQNWKTGLNRPLTNESLNEIKDSGVVTHVAVKLRTERGVTEIADYGIDELIS